MEENDFLLNIVYKNKSVKFKVVNPDAPLATLMNNLRHAIGGDGRLVFDFPSIDETGAPLDYFFGKEGCGLFLCLYAELRAHGFRVHYFHEPGGEG